uniref:Uncharacterized protein n=1 Tax=Mimivirus LCMiAC01 TaxID=2506608 RepID=A0A481YZS5_9VIRU|nr:MAG: hypothetical protein LCMiAC01_03470 [Mimivirus LCMiAC01]
MKYLKQFIIGSSYLVFLPYFYSVQKSQSKKNYSYFKYTLIAPVWLGVWNVISLILAEYFNLSMEMRFLVVSIISSLCIMFIATYLKSYNFDKDEWKKYYFYIFVKYLIIWNLVVYSIEKYI